MKKAIFASLILFIDFGFCNEEIRGIEAKVDIRHKEPGGIGYDNGYTTVDLLCLGNSDHFEALVNLRGHVFNDGNLAGNIGCGFRLPLYSNNYLVGANVYYDCRQIPLGIVQQLGVGAEWIGAVDFRINWYMPIGKNTVSDSFLNNNSIERRSVLGALPVIEGEVGIPFTNVYLRVGPYYFYEQKKDEFSFGKEWGGRVSANINIGKDVSLGCSASYDKIFKHKFQGWLSFPIPLSRSKPPIEKKRDLRSVSIMRNEIIPLQIKNKEARVIGNNTPPPLLEENTPTESLNDGNNTPPPPLEEPIPTESLNDGNNTPPPPLEEPIPTESLNDGNNTPPPLEEPIPTESKKKWELLLENYNF